MTTPATREQAVERIYLELGCWVAGDLSKEACEQLIRAGWDAALASVRPPAAAPNGKCKTCKGERTVLMREGKTVPATCTEQWDFPGAPLLPCPDCCKQPIASPPAALEGLERLKSAGNKLQEQSWKLSHDVDVELGEQSRARAEWRGALAALDHSRTPKEQTG